MQEPVNLRFLDRLKLCWRILGGNSTQTLAHASRELQRLIPKDDDGTQLAISKDILELVYVFSTQGHSGFTAGYTIDVLSKLLRHQPLTDLTGEPDEWRDTSNYGSPATAWQNIRNPAVFKGEDGQAYFIDGRIFQDPEGVRYTDKRSKVDITFPCNPTSEVFLVDGNGDYLYQVG